MTKQKFYEEVILKSYDNADGTAFEYEAETLMNMMNWPPKSFSELIMKRAICGFPEIPKKQQFDKLGFSYLAQVIGFVVHVKDDDLTYDFFEFLEKNKNNKKIIDVKNEEHADVLFDSYYDTLCGESSYSSFCEKMADFILLNCEGTEAHNKCLKLSYALGRTKKVGLVDMINMKRKKNDLKPIKDLFSGALEHAI